MEEKMHQDKIIQNEVLLQALSLKLSELRHKDGSDLEVSKLVQLRRDIYSGKVENPSLEISKLQ